MYKLGWFSTGRGQGSQGLLKAAQESIESGETRAEIEFVFCSREPGESEATDQFLKMAADYHLPVVTFSYQRFKSERGLTDSAPGETLPPWRLDYDREVMARLAGFIKPDLSILAGYMLIVGPEMCQRYDMLNLHPAAPDGPTGTWRQVIWQLIESKAPSTGVMMHLATPELDKGPPVTYCTFSLRGEAFDRYWEEFDKLPADSPLRHVEANPLFQQIRKHGLSREFPLIIATIGAFSQGRVEITPEKKVIDAGGRPIAAYDLSDEIDWVVGATGKPG